MTSYDAAAGSRYKKYDLSLTSIGRALVIVAAPLIALTLGGLPSIISLVYVIRLLDFSLLWHVIVFGFILMLEVLLLIVLETLMPAVFIWVLRLRVAPGEYEVTIRDRAFFKYALFYVLYRPALRIVGFLPLVPLRVRLLRLAGLVMGKTSVLAGSELIHDPYMVEIGENTLIGGYSWILGHIAKEKLILKPVRIGDNCLIGGRAIIMPGAVIEDDVTVGLQALVLEDQVLKAGKTYVGIPARSVDRDGDGAQ